MVKVLRRPADSTAKKELGCLRFGCTNKTGFWVKIGEDIFVKYQGRDFNQGYERSLVVKAPKNIGICRVDESEVP
jgi:hypothetical protein